jgi:DNA invertase Pin-like site-specific DNA recombinase
VAGAAINLAELAPSLQIRLEPSQVVLLVDKYEEGASVNKLAEQFRVDRTTVLAHLRRREVPKQVRRTLGPDEIENAIQLYVAGGSVKSVARQLQVSSSTMGRILNRAGVAMRPRGRRRSS